MIKKTALFILFSAGLLAALYFFQPVKKGKGLYTATKYRLVVNWPRLPSNLKLGNPTGIGIDARQNIVVFHRADRDWPLIGSMPDKPIQDKTILIIDKDSGKLLNSWGNGLFMMPHGLTVDSENNVWVTDVGLHQVFKFSHQGQLLMKLGEAGVAGSDSLHFNKPTDIAVAKDGSFYVGDGYGNSRIVKFSASGNYLFAWGKKGNKEGEFNLPHGLSLDSKENVYVADRENNRIQVFAPDGKFITQVADDSFGAIYSVAVDKGNSTLVAIDDFTFLGLKHRGSDIFIFNANRQVQTRFGRSGSFQGALSWYHDLAVDDDQSIYVGDILGNTIQKFEKVPHR